ncbi:MULTISPECIES: histidine kinase [Paenibacillus]|uniref:sensor histidine kinase n=1 Tax=Paenibacillus TaxID=44249 RepID=UPI0003E26D36|nr:MULTISPECIES: histidine kinase [Paenibacillus]ETT63932.1 signal transduction histidine kinase LytS [Paenibacillus sp. FSL H8-237]MEC0135001.1 histidine kinase [Paenibacillus odorifer]MEC0224984.1 histidine kinase [Paenibacillus odorifer]OMD02199.1 sensor histidine kinase [Paenibacillus odorifer]OME42984.1 sensor histidine kinase [Paenibacillus odorifer]
MKSFSIGWNPDSIVIKLIGAFLLVMLPLCALSISITYYSSNQMQAEVERANESKVHFYYSHLEFELQRITGLVTEYSQDETLATFSTRIPIMSRYEVDSNLNNIYTKLKQIKETSPYISDVVYYVPEINKRVSAAVGVRDVTNEEWQSLLATMGNLKGALSKYEDELYLLRSNPYNLDRNLSPNFLLGVKLSSPELELRLKEFAVSGGSDITLAFGNNDYVISTSDQKPRLFPVEKPLNSEDTVSVQRYRYDDSFYYSLYDHSNNFRLTANIPNTVLMKPIHVYSLLLWLLFVVSIVIIILFSLWTYRMIHRPMSILIRGFKKAEQGQTGIFITHSRRDEFGYLYSRFNEMLKHLNTLIDENYVQRIRTGEAELKHLQSQITPHFLYNSLFSIKQMAEVENVELIKEFSDYLGQYFRYMTRDSAQEVTLQQEQEHALVYLAIQRIRFGARIRAEVDEIAADCRDIKVPRVLLQPIIENVFEHGLKQKSSNGLLKMSYEKVEHTLTIIIEDNGDSLSEDKLNLLQRQFSEQNAIQGEITGLLNVNQRLRIKFGSPYGLQAERSCLGGLCVRVNLPLKGDVQDATNDDS